jgi:hypothetical protein
MGVTSPYFMTKAVLEGKDGVKFDEAVDAFMATSDDIARRRTHEKARNVHANTNRNKSDSGHKRSAGFPELLVFCAFCFAKCRKKFPHDEKDCYRKHGGGRFNNRPSGRPSANLARSETSTVHTRRPTERLDTLRNALPLATCGVVCLSKNLSPRSVTSAHSLSHVASSSLTEGS